MTMTAFKDLLVIQGDWLDGEVSGYDETVFDDEHVAKGVADNANRARIQQDAGVPMVTYKVVTLKDFLEAMTKQAERQGYQQGVET